jgi:peptide/nickel transport system permease protein
MKRIVAWSAVIVLASVYLGAWLAPFMAPYSHREQFRDAFLSPPTVIRIRDEVGDWHWPFVYALEKVSSRPEYRRSSRRVPVAFLVEGSQFQWMGMDFRTHLFGLESEDQPIFILGSDELGRDLFSRILFGSRFTLTIGFVAIVLTLAIGVALGALSGYLGGWVDRVLMRATDLFLSLPALFLILGIRAAFPHELPVRDLYWLIAGIFALLGWASVARVVRGQVLSLKTREYVLAARAMGASSWWILRRHILPFTGNYLVVQASVLVPAFILGEITLSFLGVGVQEPDASWGNLLIAASSIRNLTTHPWLLTPVIVVFFTVLAFNLLGDELKTGEKRRQVFS